MKITISILLSLLSLYGCKPSINDVVISSEYSINENNEGEFKVVVYDSCEYVVWSHTIETVGHHNYVNSGMSHKGNCRFCGNHKK